MQNGDALAEAERDVRELEQYVADQCDRIAALQGAGMGDEESKAEEGLSLLSDALEIARRRLWAMRTELRELADLNHLSVVKQPAARDDDGQKKRRLTQKQFAEACGADDRQVHEADDRQIDN